MIRNSYNLSVFMIFIFGCSHSNGNNFDSDIESDADFEVVTDADNHARPDADVDSHTNSDSDVDILIDSDEDGYIASIDCDDSNPLINPGADELCDGEDNNCDGNIDEGFDSDIDGYTSCGGDCNDSDENIYPEALEYCNGIDNDCDGTIDNDCVCYCPTGGCICVPGSERYCDTPMYSRWGIQTCNANGLRWGNCIEIPVPSDCSHIDTWYSPTALECCASSGYCCQDFYDSDGDGEMFDSIGDCNGITCE